MKTIIVLAVLVALALARPQNPDAAAEILRSEFDNIGIDGYKFAYETSNQISREEQGTLKNAGSEDEIMEIHGQYSYMSADGKKITVTFVADENGFRPQTSIS